MKLVGVERQLVKDGQESTDSKEMRRASKFTKVFEIGRDVYDRLETDRRERPRSRRYTKRNTYFAEDMEGQEIHCVVI